MTNMRVPSPKKRKTIIGLFRAPVVFEGEYILVRAAEPVEGKTLLISVPKKCGKAVRRNRIRRIVREWFRVRWDEVPEFTVLVRVSPKTRQLSKRKLSPSIRAELEKALEKLKKFNLPQAKDVSTYTIGG